MNSYWDLLPPEMKEYILAFKESQELIEWRESTSNRVLCEQIRMYGQLRREWFIGPVECRCFYKYGCQCQPRCMYMLVFGHYWTLPGSRAKAFLDFGLGCALMYCDFVKNSIAYQTNPEHTMNVIAYL